MVFYLLMDNHDGSETYYTSLREARREAKQCHDVWTLVKIVTGPPTKGLMLNALNRGNYVLDWQEIAEGNNYKRTAEEELEHKEQMVNIKRGWEGGDV